MRAIAGRCPALVGLRLVVAPLLPQTRCLGRLRVAPAQLIDQLVGIGRVVAQTSHANALPQRLSRGLVGGQQAVGIELGAIVGAAFQVQLGQVVHGHGVGRIHLERAQQIALGAALVTHLHQADAGVVQRLGRRGVGVIGSRHVEVTDGFTLTARLAQVPAVVVVQLGILRRQLQALTEVGVGLLGIVHGRIDQTAHAMSGCVVRVDPDGLVDFLQRQRHVAALVVVDGQLQADAGATALLFGRRDLAADRRDAFGRRSAGRTATALVVDGLGGDASGQPQAQSQHQGHLATRQGTSNAHRGHRAGGCHARSGQVVGSDRLCLLLHGPIREKFRCVPPLHPARLVQALKPTGA